MTEINHRIEEVKKIEKILENHSIWNLQTPEARKILAEKLYHEGLRLFPQPLDGEPLLTPEEREIALDDMRERASCGDSEQEPSLDDCVYIGSVYQLEKGKTKLRASPQPLDDKELRERAGLTRQELVAYYHDVPVKPELDDISCVIASAQRIADAQQDNDFALLQPKIEEARRQAELDGFAKGFAEGAEKGMVIARRQERERIIADLKSWKFEGKSDFMKGAKTYRSALVKALKGGVK